MQLSNPIGSKHILVSCPIDLTHSHVYNVDLLACRILTKLLLVHVSSMRLPAK